MKPFARFSVLLLLFISLSCAPATLSSLFDEAAINKDTPASAASGKNTPADTSQPVDELPDVSPNDGWKRQAGFSIHVPAPLVIEQDGQGILLRHSIPYGHTDPCDFKDGRWLADLTDFHMYMELLPASSLAEAKNAAGYIYLEGEQSVEINGLTGSLFSIGVEGCGQDIYFFPQRQSATLLVVRNWITELSDISPQRDEYLSLQGVLSPQDESELFSYILRTFRLYDIDKP